ncbi:MAG: dihydroneopterin aldolase [Casimicrobiaceae bacterium]|nr:dihydroneopterin aldolase [Casimicrobiaceae bacterium]MCX8098301.1 dihydroneopterin aldolase [Casimicrobiaceae bacterium]MDW8311763.1 dihydroneopterin aldolase [Burkholderiales bacterium]
MSQSTILVRGLRCETVLGLHAWERTSRRPVVLDLEIEAPSLEPFLHDRARGLVNYEAVADRLTQLLPTLAYRTVERLAEHIAQVLIEEFHAPRVRVTVSKPGAIAAAQSVGVTIVRQATTDQGSSAEAAC